VEVTACNRHNPPLSLRAISRTLRILLPAA
jgi:hypothetical protein